MPPTIYGAVDLVKNELRNAVIQNLGTAPATPVKGQLYFDTAANVLYWYDGTVWQSAAAAALSSTVTTLAIGGAAAAGSSAQVSRGDHSHGMPGFGVVTQEVTFGGGAATGAATTVAHSDHMHGNPVHDAAAHSAIPISALAAATTAVNMNASKIINLADPTANTDAVTKQYADNLVAGLSWKSAVRVATTANLAALSGLLTIDGVTVVPSDRVLVKDQTTQSGNGIYLAASGAWTRATDADAAGELPNAACYVSEGTTNADTAWVQTTNAPITVGTTNLVWVQFTGAAQITAGAGMTKTGNTLDVVAGDTTLTVAADSLVVNTSVIATQSYVTTAITGMAKKFAAALTGTASPETVTHNLNTRDVQVTVLNGASPYTVVEVDWDATTVNTVTIRYNPNLGAGYRVVVVG